MSKTVRISANKVSQVLFMTSVTVTESLNRYIIRTVISYSHWKAQVTHSRLNTRTFRFSDQRLASIHFDFIFQQIHFLTIDFFAFTLPSVVQDPEAPPPPPDENDPETLYSVDLNIQKLNKCLGTNISNKATVGCTSINGSRKKNLMLTCGPTYRYM